MADRSAGFQPPPPADLPEQIACGVCQIVCDQQLTIAYANHYFYQLLPNPPASPSHSLQKLLPPACCQKLRSTLRQKLLQGKNPFCMELQLNPNAIFLLSCRYQTAANRLTMLWQEITRQKKQERAWRLERTAHRTIFRQRQILTARFHLPSCTLTSPPPTQALFGLPPLCAGWPKAAQQLGMVPAEGENLRLHTQFYADMLAGKPHGEAFLCLRSSWGKIRWYHLQYSLLPEPEGPPCDSVISCQDVTQQREKALAYEKWKQTYDSQRSNCVCYYEANLTQDIFEYGESQLPDPFSRIQRLTYTKLVQEVANHFIFQEEKRVFLQTFARSQLLKQYQAGQKKVRLEHRRLAPSGGLLWVEVELQMFQDPYSSDVRCFVLIKNIDQTKQTMLQLEARAKLDGLTGLLNRSTVIEKISSFLADAPNGCHALAIIDIDHFKQMNDTYGHAVGDQVLREFTAALQKNVKTAGIVGRFGGDEFLLCFPNIIPGRRLTQQLEAFCKSLSRSYANGIQLTLSLGVAIFPQDGRNLEKLFVKADSALYQAKRLGRNQYAIYGTETAGCGPSYP